LDAPEIDLSRLVPSTAANPRARLATPSSPDEAPSALTPAGAGERWLPAIAGAFALHAALIAAVLQSSFLSENRSQPEAIAVEVVAEAPPLAQVVAAGSPEAPSDPSPKDEPQPQDASETQKPPASADPPTPAAQETPAVEPPPQQAAKEAPQAPNEPPPPPDANETASSPEATMASVVASLPPSEPALPAAQVRPPAEIKPHHPQQPRGSAPKPTPASRQAAPEPELVDRPKSAVRGAPKIHPLQAPAPAAAGSGAAASASSAGSAAYQSAVLAAIAAHKHYPDAALARGPHGVAVVTFTIGGGGQVMSAQLTRSAGDVALDADAVATVRRTSPFPAPPPGAPRKFAASLNYVPR